MLVAWGHYIYVLMLHHDAQLREGNSVLERKRLQSTLHWARRIILFTSSSFFFYQRCLCSIPPPTSASNSIPTCSPPVKPGLCHYWQTVALVKEVCFEGDCGQHVTDLASTDIVESRLSHRYLTWLWQCLHFISGMCSMFFCVFAHCLIMHLHLEADSGLRVVISRALLNKAIRPLCLLSCLSLSASACCTICFLLLTSITAPLPRIGIGADPEI
jgi:hypothetical protein